MATYYWVGGNGTWNNATTTNWAATSGGAGGAGVPNSADNVIFDAASGAAPVVTVTAAVCSACTIGAPTSGTLTLAFGASTLTMAGNMSITTSISVTGTGTISLSAASPTFAGNGNTFYNLSFTSTAIGTATITGANTFNNVTFAARAAAGFGTCSIGADQTINGTLTLGSGTTGVARLMLTSNTLGTQRTLTCAAIAASVTDIDFRDIKLAGAFGAPLTGTRLGNCRGNDETTITFDAGVAKYWNLAAGGNWSAAAWALSSGGGVATTNFPLAQDNIIIENTGLTAGNTIIVNANYNIPTLDFSTRTLAMTFATGASGPTFYGNLTLDADVTYTGSGGITFAGKNTQTITSANKTLTQPIIINSPTGTVVLADNLATNGNFTLTQGTVNLNNNVLTIGLAFVSSNIATTRSIAFGTGNITLTNNNATIWNLNNVTNFSYTGTPTVNCTYSGAVGTRTINNGGSVGGNEATAISFNISAGSDTVSFATSVTNSIKNLNFTGFSGTLNNTARTFYGNLTLSSGMTLTAGAIETIFGATSGTQLITTNNKTLDFPLTFNGIGGTFAFQDALTQGSTRPFTIFNGTVQLKSSATTTVGAFATSGTNQKFLQSTTPGTQATLTQASGTVNAAYLTIRDINATGGATWLAYTDQGNTDAGNVDGWDFGISPVVGGAEYTYTLRSFTQPRRF